MEKEKGSYKPKEIMPSIKMIQGWLEDLGGRFLICGSFRRGCLSVGDIDIVTTIPVRRAAYYVASVCKVAGTRCTVMTNLDIKKFKGARVGMIVEEARFNLCGVLDESWGAMTLYLTGSRLFNILMRGRAKKQGYKLSQYGLFHLNEMVAGKNEKQIFDVLSMPYMTPAERNLIGTGRLKGF